MEHRNALAGTEIPVREVVTRTVTEREPRNLTLTVLQWTWAAVMTAVVLWIAWWHQ